MQHGVNPTTEGYMITSTKILAYHERIMGDRRPITADIFLTNYCNNRCGFCTYGRWELEQGKRFVPLEKFVEYAERLKGLGVEGFILTGGGEPTLDPDFDLIAEYLDGEHWGINTNFNVLKFIKPDYLKVSLDGYDEASYEKKRGVRAYERTLDNIRIYAQWRRLHSPHTKLGIQMIATDPDEVQAFYGAHRGLDVDYIAYRPIESTNGAYYRNHDAQPVRAAIERLRAQDSRVVLNFKWDLLTTQEKSCIAQWAQIALNEKGEVMYCCHKPYEIIGHIMDEDILSKKGHAVTNMKQCDIPCRMTASNQTVALMGGQEHACFI